MPKKRREPPDGTSGVHWRTKKQKVVDLKKSENDFATSIHDVKPYFTSLAREVAAVSPALPQSNVMTNKITHPSLDGTKFKFTMSESNDALQTIGTDTLEQLRSSIPKSPPEGSGLGQQHGQAGHGHKAGKVPPNCVRIVEFVPTPEQKKEILRQSDLATMLYNDAVDWLQSIAPVIGQDFTEIQKQYFFTSGKKFGIPRLHALQGLYAQSAEHARSILEPRPVPLEHESILFQNSAGGKQLYAVLAQYTLKSIVAAYEALHAKKLHTRAKSDRYREKLQAWKRAGKKTRRPKKRKSPTTLKHRNPRARKLTLPLSAQRHGDRTTGKKETGGLFGVMGHCFSKLDLKTPLPKECFHLDENGNLFAPLHDYKLVIRRNPEFKFELHLSFTRPSEPSTPQDTRSVIALDPGLRTYMTGYDITTGSVLNLGFSDGDKSQSHLMHLLLKADRYKSQSKTVMNDTSMHKKKRRLLARRAKDRALTLQRKVQQKIGDLHHRLARFLCSKYAVILLPKFETSNMVRRQRESSDGSVCPRNIARCTARLMNALSFYKFRTHLEHTARLFSTRLEITGEAYTSKTCTNCGVLHEKLGGSKVFKCASCGLNVSRDGNGAKGIFLRHVSILGLPSQVGTIKQVLGHLRAPLAHDVHVYNHVLCDALSRDLSPNGVPVARPSGRDSYS